MNCLQRRFLRMGNRLWLATDCEFEETSPTAFALNWPVGNNTREDDIEARLANDAAAVVVDLSFATRCAVTGSRAEICIGGKLTGDLVSLAQWKIKSGKGMASII